MRGKLLTRDDAAVLLLLATLAAVMAFAGLGSRAAPRSYWSTTREGEAAVADAGAVVAFDRVSCWVGLGAGSCAVELSRDGSAWERAGSIEQPDVFGFMEWRVMPAASTARYLRLVALRPGLEIGEVGAFGPDGARVPLTGIEGPVEPFDEQEIVVRTPTARTGMYFDETYFARSAWEQLRGLEPTETSHPPLGRTIISLGIALWGMNPFGWRFMGALAGALSVAVLYLVARRLLGKTSWACLAGMLFAFDFLRFAQSRMATVDVFVLLFTLLAFWFVLEHAAGDRRWPWLLAAGVALGAGLACKWSAAWPALGVAVLAAAAELRRILGSRGGAGAAAGPTVPAAIASAAARCLVCLAAVPLAVYAAAWLPGRVGAGVDPERPRRPARRHVPVPQHDRRDPVVRVRVVAVAARHPPDLALPGYGRRGRRPGGQHRDHGQPRDLVAGHRGGARARGARHPEARPRRARGSWSRCSCSWLPWAFSARKLTFIYHFLPASPFLVLGLVHCLERLVEPLPRGQARARSRWPRSRWPRSRFFLPLLTGLPVPRAYAEALRWLSTWIFFA